MSLILDTGPLVAMLDRRDPFHRWAKELFERLSPPFLICEAVLTEASHFVGHSEGLWSAWCAGELVLSFDASLHRKRLTELLENYRPMDFADACVVAMAELHSRATVLTIDRRDFARYRINGRKAVPVIAPPS